MSIPEEWFKRYAPIGPHAYKPDESTDEMPET